VGLQVCVGFKISISGGTVMMHWHLTSTLRLQELLKGTFRETVPIKTACSKRSTANAWLSTLLMDNEQLQPGAQRTLLGCG
jgi:hypothetical protein